MPPGQRLLGQRLVVGCLVVGRLVGLGLVVRLREPWRRRLRERLVGRTTRGRLRAAGISSPSRRSRRHSPPLPAPFAGRRQLNEPGSRRRGWTVRAGAARLRSPWWDHDLESRVRRHRRLVDDLSSVSSSVCLGDRETKAEPSPRPRDSGLRANRSKRRGTNSGETPAPRSSTASLRCLSSPSGDRDRWLSMPQGVRDQVREHAIESRRIDNDLEIGWNRDPHCVRSCIRERTNQFLDFGPKTKQLRRNVDRCQVEAREVEQLLDQVPHPVVCSWSAVSSVRRCGRPTYLARQA